VTSLRDTFPERKEEIICYPPPSAIGPEAVFNRVSDLVASLAVAEPQRGLLRTALTGLKLQAQEDEFLIFARVPLLVYAGCGGEAMAAVPLAAATTLLFLGIDILDDLADGDLPGHWQGYRPSEINLTATTLLAALPQLIIAELDAPASRLAAMQRTLALGLLRMSAGQQRDLALAGSSMVSPREVEDLVAAKSGAEVAMFATLAAQFAGAGLEAVNAYAEFGRTLGTGAQLASDCHDLFQAPHSKDLANGTRTLPIALFLKRLSGEERTSFLTLLEQARVDVAAQEAVRGRLRPSGVVRHCAFMVELYCQRGLRALEQAAPREPAATGLKALVDGISFFPQKDRG